MTADGDSRDLFDDGRDARTSGAVDRGYAPGCAAECYCARASVGIVPHWQRAERRSTQALSIGHDWRYLFWHHVDDGEEAGHAVKALTICQPYAELIALGESYGNFTIEGQD